MTNDKKTTAPDTLPADFDFNQGQQATSDQQKAPDTLPADFDFSRTTKQDTSKPGFWDKGKDVAVRYGTNLAESLGLPSTKEQLQAQAQAEKPTFSLKEIGKIALGPVLPAAEAAYGYGKNVVGSIKEGAKEAYEAGENIGEGQPVLPNIGKAAYGIVKPQIEAVPLVGEPTVKAGEKIATGDIAGGAGQLTGAIGQVVLAEALKGGGEPEVVGSEYLPEGIRNAPVPEARPQTGLGRVEYRAPTPSASEPSLVGPEYTEGQTPAGPAKPQSDLLGRAEYREQTPFEPEITPEKAEAKSAAGSIKQPAEKPAGEPKSAAEFHPDVKKRVSELSNADLRTLGESFGLNPEEYDFAKREPLHEGGSKHPIDRYRFVDDLMGRMPDGWIERFGKLSEDAKKRQGMFFDRDITSQKRARQSRAIFRDRLGIPQATNETKTMSEAELLKHGFDQRGIDAGLHLPSVGGGAAATAVAPQANTTVNVDPARLLDRWGVDESSLVRGREQTRGQMSSVTEQQVQSLIDAYKSGDPVEPVIEVRDADNNIIEVDGRMRVVAAKRAGIKNIPVIVKRSIRLFDRGGTVELPEELVPVKAHSIFGTARSTAVEPKMPVDF